MNTFDSRESFLRPPNDEWYVYQDDGRHTGPLSLDLLVGGLAAGSIPRTAFAGFAGEGRWRPVLEIPEIAAAVRAAEAVTSAPPSSRVPSSMAPAAPPLGFVTPPRVAQVASPPHRLELDLDASADETIPAPSNAPPAVRPAPMPDVSSLAATVRQKLTPSPIPASLPAFSLPPPSRELEMPIPPARAPLPPPVQTSHPLASTQESPIAAPIAATLPTAVVPDAALAAALAKPVDAPAPKKAVLDPRLRFLPFAIFGACALVAAIEVVVGVALG